ncbi:MAG TPA: hypothetical protein VIX20_09375 [Ktedonobacteraceae bacterium]
MEISEARVVGSSLPRQRFVLLEIRLDLLVKKQYPCYTFSASMAQEYNKPLDISAVQQAFEHQPLPAHERFGDGERYTFGNTTADVYTNPPELTPVVYVRMVKGYLAVGDVLHILPTDKGGLHTDHANGACEIGNTGDVAAVYTPPAEFRVAQVGGTHTDVYGISYTQTSLEVEGTAEGVRVMLYGTLEAAPKAVNTKRSAPLQFFLLEYDPETPQEPIRHEVWARSKAREALQGLKLKKGDTIEAVLYRHTWEVELQGGETETHTRHNLATITKVERIGTAKRKTSEQ